MIRTCKFTAVLIITEHNYYCCFLLADNREAVIPESFKQTKRLWLTRVYRFLQNKASEVRREGWGGGESRVARSQLAMQFWKQTRHCRSGRPTFVSTSVYKFLDQISSWTVETTSSKNLLLKLLAYIDFLNDLSLLNVTALVLKGLFRLSLVCMIGCFLAESCAGENGTASASTAEVGERGHERAVVSNLTPYCYYQLGHFKMVPFFSQMLHNVSWNVMQEASKRCGKFLNHTNLHITIVKISEIIQRKFEKCSSNVGGFSKLCLLQFLVLRCAKAHQLSENGAEDLENQDLEWSANIYE